MASRPRAGASGSASPATPRVHAARTWRRFWSPADSRARHSIPSANPWRCSTRSAALSANIIPPANTKQAPAPQGGAWSRRRGSGATRRTSGPTVSTASWELGPRQQGDRAQRLQPVHELGDQGQDLYLLHVPRSYRRLVSSRPTRVFNRSLTPTFEDNSDLDICGCPPARKTRVDRYSRARLGPNGPRINWTVVAENWKVKTATL